MQMWKMAEKKKKSRGGFINTVTVEDELRVERGVIQRIIDQQLHISQAFSFTRLQQHNEVVLSALGMVGANGFDKSNFFHGEIEPLPSPSFINYKMMISTSTLWLMQGVSIRDLSVKVNEQVLLYHLQGEISPKEDSFGCSSAIPNSSWW